MLLSINTSSKLKMSGDEDWVQDWMTELLEEDKGSYVGIYPLIAPYH